MKRVTVDKSHCSVSPQPSLPDPAIMVAIYDDPFLICWGKLGFSFVHAFYSLETSSAYFNMPNQALVLPSFTVFALTKCCVDVVDLSCMKS